MHHAAKSNSINIATIIKHVMRDLGDEDKLKSIFNAPDESGFSPVFLAIENFNMDMFDFLLKNNLFEITQREKRNNESVKDFLDRMISSAYFVGPGIQAALHRKPHVQQ